jgi:dipeptidyl aminopeptidase/acylaminoacyl peptidase
VVIAAVVVAGSLVALGVVAFWRNGRLDPEQSCPSGRDLIIVAMDVSGDGHGSVQELRPGKKPRVLAPGWLATEPSISPDGRKVVVNRAREDGMAGLGPVGADLWVVGVDGSNPLQLTDGGTAIQPSWSPDGRIILYLGSDEGQEKGYVATLPADGSGTPHRLRAAQIALTGSARSPTWSPDGSQIAFAGDGEDGDVVVMDSDGGNERTIKVDGNVTSVVWDPGGETLTVTVVAGDPPRLMKRVNVATGHQSTLGPGSRARWSKDGERLYISDFHSTKGDIISVSRSAEDALAGPRSIKDIDPPLQMDPTSNVIMDFDVGPCL